MSRRSLDMWIAGKTPCVMVSNCVGVSPIARTAPWDYRKKRLKDEAQRPY